MEPTPLLEVNALLRAGRRHAGGAGRGLRGGGVARVVRGGRLGRAQRRGFRRGGAPGLADTQTAALQTLHGRLRALPTPWTAHLEGSYFPADMLRICARRDEPLVYFDRRHRTPTLDTHCNTAAVRQVVRQHRVRLAGAEPTSLVDPMPVEVLRAEIYSRLSGWGREVLASPKQWAVRFYQGLLVLDYCRAWCDLTTGTVGSKRRTAGWAKARVPPAWAEVDRPRVGDPGGHGPHLEPAWLLAG